MDKISLVVIIVIGVLIFRQFLPKEVNRFDLIGLPVLALYKTYSSLPDTLNTNMLLELFILLILGAMIGYFQARKTKVTHHQNKLSTTGGIWYITGWLLLFLGRFIIIFIFHFSEITTGEASFTNELRSFITGTGDWILWSTIAASSVVYSLTLYFKHPAIQDFIKEQVNRDK